MQVSGLVAPLLAASALISRVSWAAPPGEGPLVPAPPPPDPRLTAAPAAPAEAPPAELAMMAGAGAAMIPITLGAVLTSSGTTDAAKDRGLAVVGAGFAIAPLVSHMVLGEWKRAAIFTAVPVLSEVGMIALFSSRSDAVFHGTELSRTTFGTLMCFDAFFSVLGVVDAALASSQNPKGRWGFGSRGRGVLVSPTVTAGRFGITVGGAL